MVITDHQVARWRLANQRLVAPYSDSVVDAVGHLLAVQAENAGQAAWAVASRTRQPDADELAALLDAGTVIRTHVLRPTWHFVAAEDLGWLLELTAPRILPLMHRQLTDLGWADDAIDEAGTAIVETLSSQAHQTREQLGERLRERGIESTGRVLMLLLAVLELDRLVCSGRPSGGTHTYAVFGDRVPTSRRLDKDEALAELALRYFSGHGPATDRDLAYWATLTLTDARRGLEQVRDRLESFEHDGRTFWHAPGEPPAGRQDPAGHLLQILDEVYRGYQDSRMVLDTTGVVPTGREQAIGMALVDAQLVARMKRTLGRRAVFEISPYDRPLGAAHRAALEQAAERYGAFLGLEPELRVV